MYKYMFLYFPQARLTAEQAQFENEFANTEFATGPLTCLPPPSLIDGTGQSFEVFHDSWQRPNNNTGRPAFTKPQTKENRM